MKNVKRRLKFVLFPALVLLLLLLAVPVSAASPGMPHSFGGTVKIGGVDAPIGAVISARVSDVEYGSFTTTEVGKYGDPAAHDYPLVVTKLTNGDIIHFFVNDVDTEQTCAFESGASTELNLTVAVVDTTPPTVTITALTPDPTNVNTPTFTGTATDTESNISSVEYKVDSGDWTLADASDGTLDSLSEDYTFTTAELEDGACTVYVRATDAATNTTAEADYASDDFTVDTEAPTAVTSPEADATATIDVVVSATFDEDVTAFDSSGITITGATGVLATLDEVADTITIAHDAFAIATSYTVTIPAGAVEDLAGNLSAEISWSFTTVAVTFTISATAGAGGTIEPSGDVVVDYGDDQTFAITPDAGYEIADVLVDGASVGAVSSPLFVNVTTDHTISATFASLATHTLTMVVVGTGTVTPESDTYPEGDMTITATITASGWEFAGWTTTDMAEIADPTSAETTLTLDQDKTVTATFTAVVTYDLTVASGAGGSVTDPGEDTFTYNTGTVVNLVAVPEEGYIFSGWSGDVDTVADDSAASTTITMDSAKSITANFAQVSAPENVSVTQVDPGVETITVTVEPVADLDVTEMPAGLDPQDAYLVAPAGTGSFTLTFTDVDNASDIRVYKVTDDGTWTLLEITVVGTTIEVTMDCADPILVFALPPTTIGVVTLPAGWNLLSTPILLDADSDAVEQVFDATSLANIEVSYSWDGENWSLVATGYQFVPLEATYVKVSSGASATAEFIPSGELSWPPSRQLQAGLNLIGPAPALEESGHFPDMPLDQALISIKEAGALTGYTIVVSPEHNQPGWAYAFGGPIQDLLPFKGYWVVMENADTLFGSSTTPIQ